MSATRDLLLCQLSALECAIAEKQYDLELMTSMRDALAAGTIDVRAALLEWMQRAIDETGPALKELAELAARQAAMVRELEQSGAAE